MSRYVLVHECIWESPNFKPEPFTQREAFLWLITKASWKDHSTRYGDYRYDIKRGQLVCAIRHMADKWRWHRSKVARFLDNLVKDGALKIETAPRQGASVITICNYDKYQSPRDSSDSKTETGSRQLRDRSETHNIQGYTGINRDKKDIRDSNESLVQFDDEFWPLYPKKEGKEAARKAWKSAVKKASVGQIVVGLQASIDHWAAAGTDRKFIPQPSTWLNAGRWEDEHPPDGPGHGMRVVNGSQSLKEKEIPEYVERNKRIVAGMFGLRESNNQSLWED